MFTFRFFRRIRVNDIIPPPALVEEDRGTLRLHIGDKFRGVIKSPTLSISSEFTATLSSDGLVKFTPHNVVFRVKRGKIMRSDGQMIEFSLSKRVCLIIDLPGERGAKGFFFPDSMNANLHIWSKPDMSALVKAAFGLFSYLWNNGNPPRYYWSQSIRTPPTSKMGRAIREARSLTKEQQRILLASIFGKSACLEHSSDLLQVCNNRIILNKGYTVDNNRIVSVLMDRSSESVAGVPNPIALPS
jgi:hypothetical protein